MNASSRVALCAGSAILLGGLVASAATSFNLTSILIGAAKFTYAGALVLLGTYVGARLAPPQQRSAGLIRVLVLLYAMIGVALAVPIKTHAVMVDVRASTSENLIAPGQPIVFGLGTIMISLILARGFAAACGSWTRRT